MEVIEKAFWLYYAAQATNTPVRTRTVIYAAPQYFIIPIDAIPDPALAVGYADDIGVIAAPMAAVAMNVMQYISGRVMDKLNDGFGEQASAHVCVFWTD